MKSVLRICALVFACTVVTTTTAKAETLDPAKVPQNVKWVVHVDYDALTDTKLMKLVREQHAEKIQEIRNWMQAKLGVNPQEELHNVTLFGESYDRHQGTGIVCADFNRKKVEEQFASKVDVKKTESHDCTFYTWDMEKNKTHDHGPNRTTEVNRDSAAGNKEVSKGSYEDSKVTAVLVDDKTMVFAPSVERAQAIVKLTKGEGKGVDGKNSKLIAKIPKDAFFFGSAVDLNEIKRNEGLFPVLRQHSFVMWSIGEREGKVFEALTLTGQNEEVAEQMKSGLEGLVAFANVWGADSKAISKLQENKPSIKREGATVHAEWEGNAADVAAAIDEVKDRVERRMKDK